MATFLKYQILFLCVMCFSFSAYAQKRGIITGQITDSETGDAIVGASVLIIDTSIGDATDVEGRFRIDQAPVGRQKIKVSYVGYETSIFKTEVTRDGETNLDVALDIKVGKLSDIVVVGTRKNQLDAINQKRQSENLKEVLTKNDVGRLPDVNVAEATQRVAGVALETDKGEGRFVSIRGIQPALNNVTLNSKSNLASTAGSRATALDLMPTEIISSIEVIKAITPDMEGNAVGGTVNINTISAFQKNKPFFTFSADGLMHERQNTTNFGDTDIPFRIAATAGTKMGENKKLGMVLSTNYFKRDFTVSVIDPDEWIYENGFFLPNENEIQLEDNERARFGMNSDIEYRFTDNNAVYLKTLYTRSEETALNSEFELTFEGELINQTPNSGQWTAGSMELDLGRDNKVENLSSYILGTRNRFGQLTTDVYASYSRGDTESSRPDGTFENPVDTEENIPLNYDLSSFFFDVTTPNSDFARNPDIMILRNVSLRKGAVLEENYEVSADLRYDVLAGSIPGYLKFGGRFRDRTVDNDDARTNYGLEAGGVEATNPYTIGLFALEPWNPEQGGAQPFHHGDALRYYNFTQNPENLSDTNRIVLDEEETYLDGFADDFNNSEQVIAGYAMASFNFTKFNILGGVRIENTTTTSNSFVIEEDGDGTTQINTSSDENTYTNILPSVHLKYNITDQLVGRASWSNTIGRPDFSDLSSTAEFNYEETTTRDVYVGSLERANSDLKPFESANYDASLSYFLPSGGLVSAGVFYKNIENQIFVNESELNDTTFRGLFFEELEIQQLQNADAAQLWGMEFTYDQAFLFLPGFLNGFGTSVNLALIDSKIDIPTRPNDDLPLFRQPSEVFNGVLYYQKSGFEARFAASHRSKMLLSAAGELEYEEELAAGANITDFDRYEDARTTFDILAGYTLPNSGIRITGQIRNLTNESEQSFQGIESRLDRHQLTGRTYFIAVNFSL